MVAPRAPHTAAIIRLYNQKVSQREICRQLGLCRTTVSGALHSAYKRGEVTLITKKRPWLIHYLSATRLGICYPKVFLSGLDRDTVEKFLHDAPDNASASNLLRELIRAHYDPTRKE